MVADVVFIAEFSELFVVVCVTVKSVLEKWWFYFCLSVQVLKIFWVITVADTKIMNFILFHKLFKNPPDLHCLLKCMHRTMKNQWINITNFQIFQRNLQWLFHLLFYARFWIIRNVVWILPVNRSKFSLNKQLLSWNSWFLDTLSYSSFIVMFWLTSSINSSKPCS